MKVMIQAVRLTAATHNVGEFENFMDHQMLRDYKTKIHTRLMIKRDKPSRRHEEPATNTRPVIVIIMYVHILYLYMVIYMRTHTQVFILTPPPFESCSHAGLSNISTHLCTRFSSAGNY